MGKRVLLVTIFDNKNLGNRLQHLALQNCLEEMGYEVHSIKYTAVWEKYGRQYLKAACKTFLTKMHIKKYKRNAIRDVTRRRQRIRKFEGFSQKYIHNIHYMEYVDAFKQDMSEYDCSIVGSDQVWHNWHMQKKELEFFYLTFMPKRKRIAYAPSFGFTEFPKRDIGLHYKGLMEMRALSCREAEGCDLIEDLTGRKAKCVLDPTLLYDAEQWEIYESKPAMNEITDKYLLLYFIGEIEENQKRYIDTIAEEQKLKIVNVLDPDTYYFEQIGPSEFLWLIHHAEYVMTDSFHATVFSIIYNKRFIVCKRNSKNMPKMFGRIQNLLELTNNKDRIFSAEDFSDIGTSINQLKDSELFMRRRSFSLEYLRKSIDRVDDY